MTSTLLKTPGLYIAAAGHTCTFALSRLALGRSRCASRPGNMVRLSSLRKKREPRTGASCAGPSVYLFGSPMGIDTEVIRQPCTLPSLIVSYPLYVVKGFCLFGMGICFIYIRICSILLSGGRHCGGAARPRNNAPPIGTHKGNGRTLYPNYTKNVFCKPGRPLTGRRAVIDAIAAAHRRPNSPHFAAIIQNSPPFFVLIRGFRCFFPCQIGARCAPGSRLPAASFPARCAAYFVGLSGGRRGAISAAA